VIPERGGDSHQTICYDKPRKRIGEWAHAIQNTTAEARAAYEVATVKENYELACRAVAIMNLGGG
jgi:hypothetical protein